MNHVHNIHISSASHHWNAKNKEKRRMKAAQYFEEGLPQADIARKLKVTPAAVCQWHTVWEEEGKEGLKSKGCPGMKSWLTASDIQKVKKALVKGPQSFGYETDLWTLERIEALIEKLTKVSYHPSHVWKILRAMNFTAQKPERRVRERNEEKIHDWKEHLFPRIQKRGQELMPV
jgi:transposase